MDDCPKDESKTHDILIIAELSHCNEDKFQVQGDAQLWNYCLLWADGEYISRLNVHNLHCSEQSLKQDLDSQNLNMNLRYSHLDQSLD